MKSRLLLAVFTLSVLSTTALAQATLSGSPNPFPADANGLGQITLTWSAPGASTVEIHVNAADGPAFSGGGSTGSAPTGQWVTDGMQFFLQDVSGGEPGTTLTTFTAHAAGLPGLPAGTNILISSNNGQLLTYAAEGPTVMEIHLNTPTGTLLARLYQAEGTVATGPWVTNGLRFFLQDVTGGHPLTYQYTLATTVATVIPSTPGTSGVLFGATPGIAPDPSNTGVSTTSLYWNAPGTSGVEIHVGSADGPLFAAAGPNDFFETGDWVSDGMQFYLQNASAGNPTSPANTLAIATVDVQPSTQRFIAANNGKATVSVFNSSSGQPITTVDLPGVWALEMRPSPDGAEIYVLATDGNYYVVDPLTSSIKSSINLSTALNGGPVPAKHFTWIVDSQLRHLILATDPSGLISIVDPTAAALLKTLSCNCALGPALAYDPYNAATYIPEGATPTTPDANLIVVVNPDLTLGASIVGPTIAGGAGQLTAFENIAVVQSGFQAGALVLQAITRDPTNPLDAGSSALYSYNIQNNTFYNPGLVNPVSELFGFGPHLYLQVAMPQLCCDPAVYEPLYGSIFSYQVVLNTTPAPKFQLEGSAAAPDPSTELVRGPVAVDIHSVYLRYAQATFGQNGYAYQGPVYIYKADPLTLAPTTPLTFLNAGPAPGLVGWTLGTYTFPFPAN
jgi:hypothetical protein